MDMGTETNRSIDHMTTQRSSSFIGRPR